CFSSGSVPEYLNSTLVTLVPKITNPQSMLQFRPISLCNTLYKVVSKIIVGRLRPLMCKLVSPNQVSFVPGRQISDNIFIAQEVLHRFYRARGKTGYIAWKIDLSKAYDKLRWSFIEVIMNGELTESFKPQRGVRQGDPLSPYLFVLCMEKLSHIIAARVLKKEWKAVRAARSGPLISHLFFADDLILFGEASIQQAMVMKNSLEEFCELSGQQVNFEKSLLYISANTKPDLVDQIEQTCGVTRSTDMGNYLGVPLVQGRVTKATYKGVLVKVQAKLSAWKSQLLSMVGRITLIQSVVSSIPLYTMQTAKLPQALCEDLDKSSKSFLWGSSENHHKTHLVKWDTVCLPKRLGGLGIKKAALMNQAMLSKASWRIVAGDSGLWA
ncbi:PREDICTED: reverse mRNAase, partial [Prunus dulcis]